MATPVPATLRCKKIDCFVFRRIFRIAGMESIDKKQLRTIVKGLDALIVKQNQALIFQISQRENISLEKLDAFLESFLKTKKYMINL